jgi:hypothetical protein
MHDFVVTLVGFDRVTDKLVFQQEIPASLISKAFGIAGIKSTEDWDDYRLSDKAAEKIARELRTAINIGPTEFFLQVSAPPKRRLAHA